MSLRIEQDNWLSHSRAALLKLNSSLTAHCSQLSCDVPRWPTTNVPRVVSTPWYTSLMYCGNSTTRSSCLSVVLYWHRRDGHSDVTSRRRDVTDSAATWNLSVVDSIDSHFTYVWSLTDTRQIQRQSATYSWRSSRQTTMSRGCSIPLTLMLTRGRNVSAVNVRMLAEETTYSTLPSWVTPSTMPTTLFQQTLNLNYNVHIICVMGPRLIILLLV